MSSVNEIPNGWSHVTLGDIVDTANTGLDAIKRAPIVEEETGIKCFRIQDASQKKAYEDWGNTKVEDRNFKKFKLIKGDILIARTGNSIGVHYLVKSDLKSVFNNGLIRLRVNEKANYEFLYKIIESNYFKRYVQSIAYGTSTQPNMQINVLLGLEIDLPSIEEQKAIANILTAFDDKIENLQAQNKTLEQTAQTIFKEWFGKYQVGDELPDGWRITQLRELAKKISKGTTPRKKDVEGLDGIIPFLKVKDISDGGLINKDTLELIPKEVHNKQLKRSILKHNDILFSIAGTIGRVAIVDNELENSNCNQALAFIRLNEVGKFKEYVHLWLKSNDVQNEITNSIVQGVQANVSLTVLGDLKITIPDDSKLKEWKSLISPIYSKLDNNNSQIQTLKQTRDTLLPKLMSGQLRVNEFK